MEVKYGLMPDSTEKSSGAQGLARLFRFTCFVDAGVLGSTIIMKLF
jgi:hypothetical protein